MLSCCMMMSEYTFYRWYKILKTALLFCRIVNSIDTALQLSQTYNIRIMELGHVYVLFFYSISIALIDSTLDDWGVQMKLCEKPCLNPKNDQCMDIHPKVTHGVKRSEYREEMKKRNSFMALEVLERLTGSRKATILLQSVLLNMYLLLYFIYCPFSFCLVSSV